MQRTAWVGVAILVVAVALGLIMGRVFTRHIRALSQTATRLATLDVANAGTLPDSRFRELAEASRAFNATTAGLKWFETYVPKSLVLRLMQRGAEATRSQERVLTVMFTDIRGFSTMSERMSAPDIAAMLNRHFEILSSRIEAEGGAPSTSSSAIR